MRTLRAFAGRIRGMLGLGGRGADFDAELESHIALDTDAGIRNGLDPVEARRRALIHLGGAEQTRQAYRERRTVPRLENLRSDARYAFRQLCNSPGFTLTAVLTLGLAIGANSAIFTLVDAILLRQLPFNDPSRVLKVENGIDVGLGFDMRAKSVAASFNEATRFFKTIESATLYSVSGVNAQAGSGNARRLNAAETGASFLQVLGVAPQFGRSFAPDQDMPDKDQVVLISDRLWRNQFHADPAALGMTMRINGADFAIIGILPSEMDFPAGVDLWTPTIFDNSSALREAGAFLSSVLVRARPGISVAAVRAEMNARASANAGHDPSRPGETSPNEALIVTPIASDLTKNVRHSLVMLSLAVSLLLVVACANIAGLAMVRASARSSEFAVRTALGATRGRIIEQQIVESLLVACAGGAFGVLFAHGALLLLYALKPAALVAFPRPAIDSSVLGFTALVAIATGLAFGIVPAWQVSSADPAVALKNGTSRTSARSAGFRKALVSGEIGIAFALFVAATLLLRTMANLDRVPLGYDTRGILSFSVAFHGEPYVAKQSPSPAISAFCTTVLDRLAHIPGVAVAGAVSSPPLDTRADMLLPVSATNAAARRAGAAPRVASSGYFDAMGIHIIEGRDFSNQDTRTAQRVVIVTQDLADKLWPGQSPIGQHIHCLWDCDESPAVIGVVPPNRRFGPRGDSVSEYYLPYTQQDWTYLTFVLRTKSDPLNLSASVRGAVAAVDPTQPVYDLETMRDRLNINQSLLRFELFVLMVFAALSFLLVYIGLYGVVSYTVTQKIREIGIRIALGAQRRTVVMSMVRESALIALGGEALGLVASLAFTRLLASVLFGVKPHDPATLLLTFVLFLAIAVLATYLPARRAASINPTEALRGE